jgi:hypothetical protein
MERKAEARHETLDWVLIGAYVSLIALFAGAQSVPAFQAIIVNVFVRINDVVRGWIGG